MKTDRVDCLDLANWHSEFEWSRLTYQRASITWSSTKTARSTAGLDIEASIIGIKYCWWRLRMAHLDFATGWRFYSTNWVRSIERRLDDILYEDMTEEGCREIEEAISRLLFEYMVNTNKDKWPPRKQFRYWEFWLAITASESILRSSRRSQNGSRHP